MCGRYTLAAELDAVASLFGADVSDAQDHRPRYNVAPGQDVLAVVADAGHRRASFLRWGFPGEPAAAAPHRGPWINARAETVAARPAFRESFLSRRCLVPADGFFEWEARSSSRRPYWLRPRTSGLLAFAGIWKSARGAATSTRSSAATGALAILTRDAPAELAWLHDRVPVVLSPISWEAWLSSATREATLRATLGSATFPNFLARPVSPVVNNVRFDKPACLDESVPPPGQPSLF